MFLQIVHFSPGVQVGVKQLSDLEAALLGKIMTFNNSKRVKSWYCIDSNPISNSDIGNTNNSDVTVEFLLLMLGVNLLMNCFTHTFVDLLQKSEKSLERTNAVKALGSVDEHQP